MRMTKNRLRRLAALVLMLTLVCGALMPAQAAGFTSKQPKFKATCGYESGKVVLKWGKVSGATRYEVYRSAKKTGGYAKFATVTTNTLKKATTGMYFYKVRAVNKNKQKSKFSKPVQIFAANARITNVTFSGTGWTGTMGTLCSVKIANKSKKAMQFLGGYAQHATLYLINRKTKKVAGQQEMLLNTNNDAYGMSISDGITVKAKSSQTLWFQMMYYTLWQQYNASPDSYYWMITIPFYPGNGNEELGLLSITATAKSSGSAVAGRRL